MKIIIAISLFIILNYSYANAYMPGYPDYKPIDNYKISTSNVYPDINSSGFIEMKVSGRDYSNDINKLETIRQDPYYKKIPNDILKGSLKLENRYDIFLEGKLDKDTEVKYNIQKEPDFPGIYNVFIRKGTSELQFGDFNSKYKEGEFVNIEKYLNGVETKTTQNKWKAKATLGKEKSEPQKYETYGNGSKSYKVGKTFLLQGSVVVYLNNKELEENKDYTINYFDGKIQFDKILTKVDYLKVIYEFTNPIQDFIPSLSRKNFTAANYTYSPSQNTTIDEQSAITKNEVININKEEQIIENRINLSKTPVKLGSELIYLNDKLLTRGIHYFLKNDSGLIRFVQKQLNFDDKILAKYQYYETKDEKEMMFGNGTPGPFKLKQKYPIKETIKVTLGNIEAKEFIDYMYNVQTNSVEFYYPVYQNKMIEIEYKYRTFETKELSTSDSNFSISITHLDESTSVRDNLTNFSENESPASVYNNVITLNNNPIDFNKASFFSIKIKGEEIEENNYIVDYYRGTITLTNYNESFTQNDVQISYYYLTNLTTAINRRGTGACNYTHKSTNKLDFRPVPIKFNGIERVTMYDGDSSTEYELEEDRDYTVEYLSDSNNEEFDDINIKFLITGNSSLNNHGCPDSNDTLKFTYKYSPSPGDTEAESTHSLTDIKIQQKISENWKIITEVANTKYNYSKTSEENSETFTTEQEDNKYSLAQSPIVQNSERIFIGSQSQTRNEDYYISYEDGTVTFINKTIPNGTEVEFIYEYYISDTPNKNDVNAVSISSEYKPLDNITIKNQGNVVDPNFLPIGNINLSKGTAKYIHEIDWKINQKESVSFLHENETIQNNQYDELLKKQIYQTDLNINIQQLETTHKIRFENTNATANYSETSKKIISYDNSLGINLSDDTVSLISNISQKNEKKKSGINLNSLIGGTKLMYTNNFKIKNIIESGDIIPYAGITIDKTNSNDETNYNKQIINSYGLTSKASFNQFFNSRNTFDKSTYRTYYMTESFTDPYYNYSSLSNFNPFPWISTNANISHEESISPIPGQENKVETRKGLNIARIANDAGLEYLKFPKFLQKSFKSSYSTLGYLNTNKRENNKKMNFFENRFYGSINSFQPFDGFKIPKFKADANVSDSSDRQETSYQKFSSSKTIFYNYDTSFNYKPNFIILNKFLFDGKINYSNSDSRTSLEQASGTENTTETIKIIDNQAYGANINIPEIPLLITKVSQPSLRLERKWAIEKNKNKTDSTDESQDKLIIDDSSVSANILSLNYNVFKNIKLKNTALDEKSYFNRNRVASAMGTLYKSKMNLDQEISSQLFQNFKNIEYFKFERLEQYKNSTINITSEELKSNFNNYLKLDERIASHETQFNISQLLSVTGKLEYQDFTQKVASGNSTQINTFYSQNKGTSGLVLKPLSGLTMEYNYSIKQLSANYGSSKKGNSDLIKVKYNPIKYENFEIQVDISREKNWGFGFNTIEKDQLLQTTSETLSINVINRDDTVYLGSVNLNIMLPINNSEHLEKIIFTSEGYFKKVVDNINPENSIMVNGVFFNIRMEL